MGILRVGGSTFWFWVRCKAKKIKSYSLTLYLAAVFNAPSGFVVLQRLPQPQPGNGGGWFGRFPDITEGRLWEAVLSTPQSAPCTGISIGDWRSPPHACTELTGTHKKVWHIGTKHLGYLCFYIHIQICFNQLHPYTHYVSTNLYTYTSRNSTNSITTSVRCGVLPWQLHDSPTWATEKFTSSHETR